MRICFFINSLNGSAGSERMAVLLANQLASEGHDVSMISKQGGTEMVFFDLHSAIAHYSLFQGTGINIYKTYFEGLGKYRKLLDQIKPNYIIDVCVAMSLMTLPAVFEKNIKVISWEHFNAKAYFNIVTAKLSKWMASKFAKQVVVLTTGDKAAYQTMYGARRVAVIPNPVTINVDKKADLNSKYVLAIGRLTAQKGFDMLLDAWKLVAARSPGWKLRIVGDGELEIMLKEQCASHGSNGSVEFVKPTLQVQKYYHTSSIFVMSSRFEGLPLVLIEAKAHGLPIISFDCETGPREIVHNGTDGILVPPNNIEELAQAMMTLINDKDKRLQYGMSALENIDSYSPENFYKSWKQILNII